MAAWPRSGQRPGPRPRLASHRDREQTPSRPSRLGPGGPGDSQADYLILPFNGTTVGAVGFSHGPRRKALCPKSLTEWPWPFAPYATTNRMRMRSCGAGCQGRPRHVFQAAHVLAGVPRPKSCCARKLFCGQFSTDCPVMSCTGRSVMPCRCVNVKVLVTQMRGHVHALRATAKEAAHNVLHSCTSVCFDLTASICRE